MAEQIADAYGTRMPPRITFGDILKAYKWKGNKFDGSIGVIKITYDDVFHLKNLYKLIFSYLQEQGFTDMQGGKWYEDYYLERHTGGVVEYIFDWSSQKKINDYYRYIFKINYHCIALSKVKIKYGGKELGMNKGEINIALDASIETDYQGKWKKHPILTHFKNGYDNIIFDRELSTMHWNNLFKVVYRLHALIKGYLNLRTLAPVEAMLNPIAEGTEGRWPTIE